MPKDLINPVLPEAAPSAESGPVAPATPVTILPKSELKAEKWQARRFRDNHALGRGGSVILVGIAGEIGVFHEDPAKLSQRDRDEIAKILALPRYNQPAK